MWRPTVWDLAASSEESILNEYLFMYHVELYARGYAVI